jgi:hypothetical protein
MKTPRIIAPSRRTLTSAVSALGIIVSTGLASGQVVLGQVDDFETDLAGWGVGLAHPAPPFIATGVGPAGALDDSMQLQSFGGIGVPGRTITVINEDQWTGDFPGAGVASVRMDLNNIGATDLILRVGLRGPLNTWFVSSSGAALAAASGWQTVSFSLVESDLTRVLGSDSYASTMSSVSEFRLLHAADPAFQGDSIEATLLVDNITAVPEPGMGALPLGLAAIGTVAWLRRRARAGGAV